MHRLLFSISGLAYAAATVWAALAMPNRVATHFGLDGTADDWSSARAATIFLVALGVGMAALFVAFVVMCQRTRLSFLNVPNKAAWTTEESLPEARAMAAEDMYTIGWMTMAFLTLVPITFALGSTRLGVLFYVAFGAYVLGVGGWLVLLWRRWNRGPNASPA